jgi:fused signal recognition particle receptor
MFDRLRGIRDGLRKSREVVFGRVNQILDRRTIDEPVWDELEELLLQADVGVPSTTVLLGRIRDRTQKESLKTADEVRSILQEEMTRLLEGKVELRFADAGLTVILVVGVNGTGKTTTIGKLAYYLRNQGHKVLLAAADTYRAAAIDQLAIWAERASVPIIAHQPGADPGAVVFDAVQAARSRDIDTLIVDTAGRLHTRFNLMAELKKVRGVLQKLDPSFPNEVLLVMDATTGQNGISQTRSFTEAVGLSGIVLAKLDGTAKGGVAFPIYHELQLPIKFIGLGEKIEDLAEFDPNLFVESLLK